MREERVVNELTTFFDRKFKRVDNIDLSAVLCPEERP